jgi:poly(3-hydroxybutyrate) depolymerase
MRSPPLRLDNLKRPLRALRAWVLAGLRALRSRGLPRLRALLSRVAAPRRRWLPRVVRRRALWRHGSVHHGRSQRMTWRYGLYTPRGLRDGEGTPLIVLLHGCTQRGVGFAQASGWTRLADEARVRLLCPEQRREANRHGCWNWFHAEAQNGHGELGVIHAMVDDVRKTTPIDKKAIAAVGISAGGALSALLAFHSAKRFRAVIAVAAPPLLDNSGLDAKRHSCAPLAIIHGTADRIVPPHCADRLEAQALESLRRAGKNPEREARAPEIERATVTDFRARGKLLLRRVDLHGHGHAWTGGPGGHHYCVRSGAPLTALCHSFLRDVGMLA